MTVLVEKKRKIENRQDDRGVGEEADSGPVSDLHFLLPVGVAGLHEQD